MDRMACVDVPALPLQIFIKEHPDWKDYPVAVVADDKPQASILWVNEKARRSRILPGERYAAALSIASDLRAGTVSQSVIDRTVASLTEVLQKLTPEVEPATTEPGVFWLNAQGLDSLYGSLEDWTRSIREALGGEGFVSTVIVGFTRFGTYAIAKSFRGVRIFRSVQQETATARRVFLDRLSIDPAVRETLNKLGARTVDDLLELPAEGIGKRFGDEAQGLHELAANKRWTPLQPKAFTEPVAQQIAWESPEPDVERLLFIIKRLLDALLKELDRRGEALQELILGLTLDHAGKQEERIRPAAPTLDSAQILGLVRLRLESLKLTAGVLDLEMTAVGDKKAREQLSLFAEKPRRDIVAASRAFARLRAEFGEGVVVHAELLEGHLPRSQYRWLPLEKAARPRPGPSKGERRLVRRIYENPLPLPPRSRHEPVGWLLRGLEHGPVQKFVGPYIVSGGWWRSGVLREYYFVKMKQGEIYWAFFDRRRRRWFLEGRVE